MSRELKVGDVYMNQGGTTYMILREDSSADTKSPYRLMWLTYCDTTNMTGEISTTKLAETTGLGTYIGNIKDLLPKIAQIMVDNYERT